MNFDDPEFCRKWLRRHQNSVRYRAKRSGLEFDLSDATGNEKSTVENLYAEQGGLCAVTGVRFSLETYKDALVKHPLTPSLDRRSSKRGYTKDNVRLVCVAVNFGLGEWGDGLYLSLAEAATELNRSKAAEARNDPDADTEWYRQQQSRIEAAEKVLTLLPENKRTAMSNHIAGLKSALSKGPKGLKQAGAAAALTRHRLAKVRERAQSVFADEDSAEQWLREPLPILDKRAPIQVARTAVGARIVEEILAKIEWGAPA